MKTKYLVMACAVALSFIGCTNTKAKEAKEMVNAKSTVDYKVMNMMDFPYQSFVKNWDDANEPVRCKLITSVTDFEMYFGAAATMGNTKPFTPSDSDFEQYQYVLVSKVVTPPENGFSFTVDSVTYENKVLKVNYSFTKPSKDAGYTVKDGFLLQVPRVEISDIIVYENDTEVGRIK